MTLATWGFAICALLSAGATVLLVLAGMLAAELIAMLALQSRRGPRAPELVEIGPRGSYAIVIPAHDEAGTIEQTLAAVMSQVRSNGRVLVVADNCSDGTAGVAAAAGASVITRQDPLRRGKGYALDFGIRSLENDPPDFVVILDADCIPDRGAIPMLVAASEQWNCPVQARYDLVAPDADAGPLARVGAFAWRVKNFLRPMGLKALGVPCLLMGTGMAFPWRTIAGSNLETGHLVEDMVLGLELAAEGQGPRFLPEARIQSSLPPSLEGQKSQRARWETGHLQVIWHLVPRLLMRAFTRADYRLLALALHVAVPPLALFVGMLTLITAASGVTALAGGSSLCFEISALATAIAAVVFAVYWVMAGRDLLSIRELVLLPGYALSKLSIYKRAISGMPIEWIRSKRD